MTQNFNDIGKVVEIVRFFFQIEIFQIYMYQYWKVCYYLKDTIHIYAIWMDLLWKMEPGWS